jgi:pimeloyl-ACP methyl ester carboxylesterase
MTGTKAEALHAWAERTGRAFLRFDYSGHGQSEGAFEDGTISVWTDDALAVIAEKAGTAPVLIGSSMGGWIALLIALRIKISGLLLLAPAPDFTERLMWSEFQPAVRGALMRDGKLEFASQYSTDLTIITRALIEDGRHHLLLDAPIAFDGPVRILHGQADRDVPWRQSLELAERLASQDVSLHFIKDGDHRLSRPQDIATLLSAVQGLCDAMEPARAPG